MYRLSPQASNRSALIDGALRCLERLPPERVTARAIAEESGANLASIGYHFGSKDALVSEAAVVGLDHWLEEIERGLGDLGDADPPARLRLAFEAVEATRAQHRGLASNYLAALARGQHDPPLRRRLARGFAEARPAVAALLGLGEDQAGEDAGGLALSMFHGLLIQTLLDPALGIEGGRMERAEARLRNALPSSRG